MNFPGATIPQLGNNAIGGSSSAILHLFSPRMFSNQGHRPLGYKFDPNFMDVAINAVNTKATSQNPLKIKMLVEDPRLMGGVMPTWQPDHMVNLHSIAHSWTFMLIVNNDKSTNSDGLTRAMSDNMQLYYGYFVDEPVNPLLHLGSQSINPNANLIITHKTVVNKHSHVGQFGMGSRLDTMLDIDIIPTTSLAAMSSRPTVVMRPEDLYSNVGASIDGQVSLMHDERKLLAHMDTSLDISSKLSVPKYNIKKILDGVADTQASMQTNTFDSTMIDFGTDTFGDFLSQNLKDNGARQADMGLQTHMILTMGTIMQRYNPQIMRIDLPHQQRYIPMDQSAGSAKNVFSSLLASVMPSIMADFVIAQISFRYNSHADALEVYGVAPMTAMSDADIKNRVNGLLFRLKSEIFPIMTQQHGQFDLNINCDCTSVTHVNLNFYDDATATPEVFEVPTLLGGFNNPLIGSSDMSNQNSTELGMFVSIIHDKDRDTPSLGGFDNARYGQSLIAHDKNAGMRVSLNINLDLLDSSPSYQPPKTNWGV